MKIEIEKIKELLEELGPAYVFLGMGGSFNRPYATFEGYHYSFNRPGRGLVALDDLTGAFSGTAYFVGTDSPMAHANHDIIDRQMMELGIYSNIKKTKMIV